jgi:hypothetical protein
MRVDGPALHSPEHPCNGHDEAPRDDVHVCRFSGTQRKTGATVTPRPRSRLGLARSQYVTVTLLAEGTGPNPTVRQHVRWISVIIHLLSVTLGDVQSRFLMNNNGRRRVPG